MTTAYRWIFDAPDILSDPKLSTYRAHLLEYELLSDLLKDAWFRRGQPIEILRSEFDLSGFDVALECSGVLRHVQLKASYGGAKTASQKINSALAEKPSGCVIWTRAIAWKDAEPVDLAVSFLVFGGAPGEPLPPLDEFKVARHTKADAQGVKARRPSIRVVPKGRFRPLNTTAALSDWLFGPPPPALERPR